MQGRVVGGRWSRSGSSTPTTAGLSKSRKQELLRRLMVTKAANRAAVHGAKLPATDAIKREEVENEIAKGKEEKEHKRKDLEKKVDSQINQSYNTTSPLND